MMNWAATLASRFQSSQAEFIPVNTLPATDQLPAAPLLVAAYVFVWVATVLYIWMIWRKLGKVEAELRSLLATAIASDPQR